MSRQSGRSLRRSRSNRMIAGVAGGFGEFFDINAIWFRLLLILAFLPGGVAWSGHLPHIVVDHTV